MNWTNVVELAEVFYVPRNLFVNFRGYFVRFILRQQLQVLRNKHTSSFFNLHVFLKFSFQWLPKLIGATFSMSANEGICRNNKILWVIEFVHNWLLNHLIELRCTLFKRNVRLETLKDHIQIFCTQFFKTVSNLLSKCRPERFRSEF